MTALLHCSWWWWLCTAMCNLSASCRYEWRDAMKMRRRVQPRYADNKLIDNTRKHHTLLNDSQSWFSSGHCCTGNKRKRRRPTKGMQNADRQWSPRSINFIRCLLWFQPNPLSISARGSEQRRPEQCLANLWRSLQSGSVVPGSVYVDLITIPAHK